MEGELERESSRGYNGAYCCSEVQHQHADVADAPGANENWPMSCITWCEALAFCI